jgi:septal ring factor EnvC (AmiA/AmiB activator)
MINRTREEISKKNEEILKLKEDKLLLLEGKEQEVKSLEKDRKNKSKMAEDLRKQERKLASDLKAKQAKRKELDVAIKKAIEAEIRAENERKKKAGKSEATTSSGKSSSTNELLMTPEEKLISNSFANNKGKLPWPVIKGAKISDFGNYPHPDVPSVMIENRGIDILVEAGTQVRCVFEGVVAGVMEIMGTKVVMVRHGEYLSVYQNLASVNVKKGDKVTTKQAIGTVAKTQTSATYELHFEIWKNDKYLNPNSWLSAR